MTFKRQIALAAGGSLLAVVVYRLFLGYSIHWPTFWLVMLANVFQRWLNRKTAS